MSTTFKKALEIILLLEHEIQGKRDIVIGMQKYEAGLEANCTRWAEVVDRFVKAGDQLAEASKNKAHRQDWWDAKAHYGIKSKGGVMTDQEINEAVARKLGTAPRAICQAYLKLP